MKDGIITLKAPAKINLTLDITGKRDNGYHDISSVMQLVSLYDTVEMKKNSLGSIRISSNARYIPTDEKNICYKAAAAYFDAAGIKDSGLDIFIKKIVPTSAGLAGGSSDGAAVLKGLESMFSALGEDKTLEVAATVGADVPFCIRGGCCLCEGIGDKLTAISSERRKKIHIVIAKNTRGLSTPFIYSKYDESGVSRDASEIKARTDAMIAAMKIGDLNKICDNMYNALESISCSEKPMIGELIRKIKSMGALGSMMSGSGPSVFGIFPDEKTAKDCLVRLKNEGITAYHAFFL